MAITDKQCYCRQQLLMIINQQSVKKGKVQPRPMLGALYNME
jgi:hypothetical protein